MKRIFAVGFLLPVLMMGSHSWGGPAEEITNAYQGIKRELAVLERIEDVYRENAGALYLDFKIKYMADNDLKALIENLAIIKEDLIYPETRKIFSGEDFRALIDGFAIERVNMINGVQFATDSWYSFSAVQANLNNKMDILAAKISAADQTQSEQTISQREIDLLSLRRTEGSIIPRAHLFKYADGLEFSSEQKEQFEKGLTLILKEAFASSNKSAEEGAPTPWLSVVFELQKLTRPWMSLFAQPTYQAVVKVRKLHQILSPQNESELGDVSYETDVLVNSDGSIQDSTNLLRHLQLDAEEIHDSLP